MSYKSVDDAMGAMHVIPGPCGLYRLSALGSLKNGLMAQYFNLFNRRSNKGGLVIGNVELVEDRIPGALLSFPLKSSKEERTMPKHGWPRTGFCYDAVFYVEAEVPLGQLVKQRRRWLNGTFATYIWEIQEGIITNSNQATSTRVFSFLLVMLHLFQGLLVRFGGPALLMVWVFRFALVLPDMLVNPERAFDPDLTLSDLEEDRLPLALGLTVGYWLLYVVFLIGHMPRAIPVKNEDLSIVRYSEASVYRSDRSSAYRPCLMMTTVVVNTILMGCLIWNLVLTVIMLGFDGVPVLVNIMLGVCFLPFVLGFLEGAIRFDFHSFVYMVSSAPIALPLMIWFTVWLPAYATTRASDLTWGNRDSRGNDASNKALHRAKSSQMMGALLVSVNTAIAFLVIWRLQYNGDAFAIFNLVYTGALSVTFFIAFFCMIYRLVRCGRGYGKVEGSQWGDLFSRMSGAKKQDPNKSTHDTDSEESSEDERYVSMEDEVDEQIPNLSSDVEMVRQGTAEF